MSEKRSEVVKLKKYYADRTSLNILRVIAFVLLIVIGIVLKYVLYIAEMKFPEYFSLKINATETAVICIAGIFALIYILYILILLPLWYNNARYYVTDRDVIAQTGVLVKNKQYMKLSAIQYTTCISAPLGGKSGFNFIIFNGYGGRLIFTFLSKKDADEIIRLIQKNALAVKNNSELGKVRTE